MDVMVAFKADLAKVGIDVTLDLADRGRMVQYRYKGWKNALLYYLWSSDQNFANSAYRYFHSKSPYYVSMKRPPDLDAHLIKTLEEDDLEQAMLRFLNKEIDLLVCTTIVESGLDIPAANTILVNRADRFGLAQMYQLRGRVGRSDRSNMA